EVLLKTLQHFKVKCFFSDDWGSYTKYIPERYHEIGKRNTQKIERKFLTFRTRIKRLARKSICFSKSEFMHDTVIGLYINRVEWGRNI
ncbi:IS1 family transposase, partial [Fangia hongkongensis]